MFGTWDDMLPFHSTGSYAPVLAQTWSRPHCMYLDFVVESNPGGGESHLPVHELVLGPAVNADQVGLHLLALFLSIFEPFTHVRLNDVAAPVVILPAKRAS